MYASIKIKLVFSQEVNGSCLAEELMRRAIKWKLLTRKHKEIVRVRDEGVLKWVPSEGTDAELDDGEFLGGVFNFEIPDIEAVKLEGLPPGRAGYARHLQVDCHEVRGTHVRPKIRQRGLEV